ncbi:hypothetical protein BST81_07650 [Leptolyngbya sp. 'hensonii']|nr:hypothetical protein BST81_07650 [Leptolyngbya sp. 'hensonii']
MRAENFGVIKSTILRICQRSILSIKKYPRIATNLAQDAGILLFYQLNFMVFANLCEAIARKP